MKEDKKIGDYFHKAGLCSEQEITLALEKQAELRQEDIYKPLGTILIEELDVAPNAILDCLNSLHLELLSQSELFREFGQESLQRLLLDATSLVLPMHAEVYRAGEKAETLFHIISGGVRLYAQPKNGDEYLIATLYGGESFDELAFLTDSTYTATARTTYPTNLLVISKPVFNRLCTDFPDVPKNYLKVLAERLAKGNEALVTASNNEKAYQQFLSQQNDLSLPDLIGQTRGINKLRLQIADATKRGEPVLISGEAGTEKLVVAAEVHKTGDRSSHPFMHINAEDVTLDGTWGVSNDLFQLETAQYSALFGHVRGSFPHAESDRLGLLQICRKGTVVIENIEFLSPAVQEDLVHCIKTGEFTPLGSNEAITTSVHIIGTSTLSMTKLKEHETMNHDLLELLETSDLKVPSLRRRKKDLRLLVDFIIIQECFKSPDRKLIKGMSDEAYQRIMGYDWPGNMEELEIVIRRAIILAQGDYLMPEDIFVGMAPPEGKHTINLLSFDQVRNVFTNRLFPVGLQLITGAVFALIFLMAFAGSSMPDSNIVLVMVWAMWWPVLVISWFFGARIWCAICPMGAANDLMSKLYSLKRKIPKLVRSYGIYFSAAGLAVIIYVEAASHMTRSPMATGFLLLSILSCAILSGLVFERRLWCRYLCPLGRLAAVFSGCSLIEVRSNSSICNSTCQTNACFKGTDDVAGCPLYQGPFSLRSNQNCIICGNCMKICKEASPAINLRIPGHELWAAVKTERVTAVFVPVILGTQILRGLEQTSIAHYLETVTQSTWAAYAIILLSGMIFSHYFLILAGNLSFFTLKDRTLLKSHLFMNAIIPLAFTFEFGYQLRPLLEHMGDFFPVLGKQIGYNLDFLSFSASNGAAKPWQVISILFGMLVSMLFLKVLIKKHQKSASKKNTLKLTRCLPIIFIAVIYISMFAFTK